MLLQHPISPRQRCECHLWLILYHIPLTDGIHFQHSNFKFFLGSSTGSLSWQLPPPVAHVLTPPINAPFLIVPTFSSLLGSCTGSLSWEHLWLCSGLLPQTFYHIPYTNGQFSIFLAINALALALNTRQQGFSHSYHLHQAGPCLRPKSEWASDSNASQVTCDMRHTDTHLPFPHPFWRRLIRLVPDTACARLESLVRATWSCLWLRPYTGPALFF